MEIITKDCSWPDVHPPHLYIDKVAFPSGITKTLIYSCTGHEAALEDDD